MTLSQQEGSEVSDKSLVKERSLLEAHYGEIISSL